MQSPTRITYRDLTFEEKAALASIKELGDEFISLINTLPTETGAAREKALAITKMEEAVMWAVKGVTS